LGVCSSSSCGGELCFPLPVLLKGSFTTAFGAGLFPPSPRRKLRSSHSGPLFLYPFLCDGFGLSLPSFLLNFSPSRGLLPQLVFLLRMYKAGPSPSPSPSSSRLAPPSIGHFHPPFSMERFEGGGFFSHLKGYLCCIDVLPLST